MRTVFHELETDHLEIHGDLAALYNAWQAGDFTGGGGIAVLDARNYGLGDGTTSDWQALTDFFTACSATDVFPGSTHTYSGIMGMLPPGTWTPVPPAAPNYGSVFPIIGPANQNNGGAVWIVGPGSGSCTITTPGTIGHALDPTSVTRGANHDGSSDHNFSGNTITLGFGSAHNSCVGQIIALHVMSRGRAEWAHYTVINVPDATHVQYMCAAPDDGTGHTANGGDLDLMKPPLTYTQYTDPSTPTTVNNTVYFCEYMLEPLNFKQPHALFLDRFTIQAGAQTHTPLDGLGVRISSRFHGNEDFVPSAFWINGVYNGTPHIHPSLPLAARAPQNTDHSWIRSANWNDGYHQLGFIDNSSSSYFRRTGQPGLGGGRDNHAVHVNFGNTKRNAFIFNDAGNFETFDIAGCNVKGGFVPLYFEGVDGVDPVEEIGIDGIEGWVKIESPGTYSFAMDETKRRGFQKPVGFQLRMEAGLSINGADLGVPGGGGSVPLGTFIDYTDKPWPAATVSLVTAGGMPTLTATVPAAMFGSDGGCDIGTIVAIGLAQRDSSMTAYSADGVTNVAANTFASASIDAGANGGFKDPDDIGLRIDCVGVAGGSDTILSVTNATTVVMAHAVTSSGSGKAWVVKNDGTKNQSGVCHESRVKTISAPSAGLVTITMPFPHWGGANLQGPYNAMCGIAGHLRLGSLHSWDVPILWDTQSLDKLCLAQQDFDLWQLAPGRINLIQEDIQPTTRRTLPSIRIWESIVRGASDGAITGTTTFTSAKARFCPLDTGKQIKATGIPGNTTVTYVSPTVVTLSNASTNATGLTWQLGAVKTRDPFRFVIQRGQQQFMLYQHDWDDPSAVAQGNLLEWTNTSNNNLGVRRSQKDPLAAYAGVAMTANPAGAQPSVTTNCDTGVVFNASTVGATSGTAPKVFYNSSVVVVAQYPSVLTLNDDRNQFLTKASTVVAGGVLLVDNGDGTVIAVAGSPTPTAGQRIVGQSMAQAASDPLGKGIAGVVLPERWTY